MSRTTCKIHVRKERQGYIFLKISETIPYPDLKISKLFRNFKEILGHKLHAFSFISTSIKRDLVIEFPSLMVGA